MNRIPIAAALGPLLLANVSCAVIFGGVMAGVQISDAQRVRQLEVTEKIRYQVPEPWVVEIVQSAKKDYKGQAIVASEIAVTLTSPTADQFVAIFIGDAKSQPNHYRGYIVRAELYKGRWILERLWYAERKIHETLSPKDDYTLWVFSKINYFDSRLGTNVNPDFWSNSRPLFTPITADGAPGRYRDFIGEHEFIAEAALHMQAARTQSLTIKRQALPDRATAATATTTAPSTATTFSALAETDVMAGPDRPEQMKISDD